MNISTALLFLFLIAPSCSREPEIIEASLDERNHGWEPQPAWPGFTLVAPLDSKRVYLVDMSGTAVHSWDTEAKPGVATYLSERGTLMKCQRAHDHPIFQDAGGHGGGIQEIDWNGDVLWNFRWDSEAGLSHHDIEEMPNGNVLVIAWDRTGRDVGIQAGRDPELLEGEEFWGGAVYEIKPTRPEGGEVVWSWHALDHIVQDHDPNLPNYGKPFDNPERIDINGDRDPDPPTEEEEAEMQEQMQAIGYAGGDDDAAEAEEGEGEDPEEAARKARVKGADWLHTNGIDYNSKLDHIALSVRRYDEVWIIDHGITQEEAKGPKGDLLYRWGNPFAYGMGQWEKRQLLGQHHIQWIPDGFLGAGCLLVFNNGARPRESSSVDEWPTPLLADGTYHRKKGRPWGPVKPSWSYASDPPEDFFSPFISGAQRLPNGNTLICSGAPGHVFEVDIDNKIVWDWRNPYGPDPGDEDPDLEEFPTALFRATRYAPDHPGITLLRSNGASIPNDPGTGPATNQKPAPEKTDEPKR